MDKPTSAESYDQIAQQAIDKQATHEFPTPEIEQHVLGRIPTVSLVNRPQVTMAFQCAALERTDENPYGLLRAIREEGFDLFVETRVIPRAKAIGARHVLLHLPTSAGTSQGDMQFDARVELMGVEGMQKVVSAERIIRAGRLLNEAGIKASAYVGTGRRDPRLHGAYERMKARRRQKAGDHASQIIGTYLGENPLVAGLIWESIGPYIMGGFQIILDTAGTAEQDSFSHQIGEELKDLGQFGGFEPRAAAGSPFADGQSKCWATQWYSDSGSPRGYTRTDPSRYHDAAHKAPDHEHGEINIWPIPNKRKGQYFSARTFIEFLAKGFGVCLYGWNPGFTVNTLRDAADQRREQLLMEISENRSEEDKISEATKANSIDSLAFANPEEVK